VTTGTETYENLDKPALISLLQDRDSELLKFQLAILNSNKREFGTKSEKLTSDQIRLSFEVPTEPVQELLISNEVVVERHTRTVRAKKPLPNDLPREERIYEPEATTCPCCNNELVKIGEERSEELEKIPAQFKIIEHVRIKKACPNCKGAKVLTPPLPPTIFPLERVRVGPGFLSDMLVGKYVDHLPYHRQEQIYRRSGIEIARQRMCDWTAGIVELLMPLYSALTRSVLLSPYIHADETTLKVQDGEEKGKCHTGYLWGFHAPPGVFFHYADSRASEVPLLVLETFRGTLQTDLYAGYNKVLVPNKCERIACLAHVRRKFIEIEKTASKECAQILRRIGDIYHKEKSAKTPAERFEIRERCTKKLLQELLDYVTALQSRTLPQAPLSKAINYMLSQRVEIERIMTSGEFDLDNNAIERQMRPIALGRKNYLFAGSHDGAHRAAVLYSLFNTCKIHNVNPRLWLADVLRRIPSERGLDPNDLLPHCWVPATSEA
jgi:transposase